jgi:hypothetical protein
MQQLLQGLTVWLRVADRPSTPSPPVPARAFVPSGTLPKSLRILDLSDNGAVGALPDFAETSLAWVNLTSNRISGPLPATWGGSARTLSVLCIGNNSLAGGGWVDGWAQLLDHCHNTRSNYAGSGACVGGVCFFDAPTRLLRWRC